MKFYFKENVLEKTKERINFLFDEFEEVCVSISGGKDSTVILNLCLDIARERNRLPLSVLWIDQEAEWQYTVDYVTKVMESKEIKPYWFQMPMVITNNANSKERYAFCWEEGKEDEWIHSKHQLSIKENIYGTDRFHDLFAGIANVEFKDKKTAFIAGVRAEEAPKRLLAISTTLTYKNITWGKVLNKKGLYTFYPIYDWSYTDIWKYIFDNKIEYNKAYDELYRYGVKIQDMRISNLHHETAIQSLLLVQEIEPKTWNKISKRITGANTIKHLRNNSFRCPKELPFMFKTWEEYAYHLIENIIQEQKNKDRLKEKINIDYEIYNTSEPLMKSFWKIIINTVLSADWDFTKYENFIKNPLVYNYRVFKQKKYQVINPPYETLHFEYFSEKEKNQFFKELFEWKELNKLLKKN